MNAIPKVNTIRCIGAGDVGGPPQAVIPDPCPRLRAGGVLILDDYGSFDGARKAVDQYLAEHGLTPFLHRIDSTGRLIIKAPKHEGGP